MKDFIVCMIVPTGIGAKIGGHAGDANPAARLLGTVCDKLILHPNVVNASDINEMPSNALYVEGAMLDDFLAGNIKLKEVRSNKILVVANTRENVAVNAVNAAKNTLGIDVDLVAIDDDYPNFDPMVDSVREPLEMIGEVSDTYASGTINNFTSLCQRIIYAAYLTKNHKTYNAIAVHTPITVPLEVKMRYLNQESQINPWGGVEAKLSKMLYQRFGLPNAHAPIETMPEFDEVVDPRLAAEVVGGSHLYCVLKGLHKAPQPSKQEGIDYIDVLVSPLCYGKPHTICNKRNIPIIYVTENETSMPFSKDVLKTGDILASNYLEAAGYLQAMRNGISHTSVTRGWMH